MRILKLVSVSMLFCALTTTGFAQNLAVSPAPSVSFDERGVPSQSSNDVVENPNALDRKSAADNQPVDQSNAVHHLPDFTVPNASTSTPSSFDQPSLNAEQKPRIHWQPLLGQWLFSLSIMNGERIMMEQKTRRELKGPFFRDWFYVDRHYQYGRWGDGDKFFTSYIGHPLQGAVAGRIFRQNDDHNKRLDQDFHNPEYRKEIFKAFAWSAVDAVQWKLGPFGEATIGHVGLHRNKIDGTNRTGLNDLVLNEVGGTMMMIGEDWLDKHVAKSVENHSSNRFFIDSVRIFSSPSRTLANLVALHRPWYRDRDLN